MKRGTCPKCGSTDVHAAFHAGGNAIRPQESGSSGAVCTAHYVWRACGYTEQWVSPEEMPLLQQNFPQK